VFKIRIQESDRRRFPFPIFYLFRPGEVEILRKAFDVLLCFQARLYLPQESESLVIGNSTLIARVPDLLSAEIRWQIGVPILTKKVDSTQSVPAFLGEFYTKSGAQKHMRSTYPTEEDFGYLLRGPDVIKPPCLACPYILLHDAGDCRLGDARCYGNLAAYLEGASYEENTSRVTENQREDGRGRLQDSADQTAST
jgi:hypothetical protein